MEKTAKVKVAFQGHDWRNEFRMKSPTGRTVTLHCNGKWKLMSPELLELIKKYQYGHDRAPGEFRMGGRHWSSQPKHEEIVTYSLMRELLELAS